MKVCVLGAIGLVGKALQQECQRQGVPYTALGHQEADITRLSQLKEVLGALAPTHIVNCAAYTDVDGAERERERAFAVNGKGPYHVGVVAQEIGARVVHLSTDYVFDGKKREPYLETDPCGPLGVYAKSKREGEESLLSSLPSACVIRTSWIFGAAGKNFFSSLLARLSTDKELKVVADQKSRLTYAQDLAEAIVSLLDYSGLVHFANAGALSRYDMAVELLAYSRKKGMPLACEKIVPVASTEFPMRARRPLYSVLDTTKVTEILGKPPRPWQEVLKEYCDHVF